MEVEMLRKLRILVAVLATATVATVALVPTGSAAGGPVVIPFTKTKVGDNHYVGTACDGASLDVRMSNVSWTGNAQHFTATFVVAGLPNGRGFTAVLDGIYDDSTGRTVLNGTVTQGWLVGAQVHEEGEFAGLAGGQWPVFTGTLQIVGGS
jgi:hypothetical protein